MYLSPCIETSLGESHPMSLSVYVLLSMGLTKIFCFGDVTDMKFSMGIKHRTVKIASLLLMTSSSSHPYD